MRIRALSKEDVGQEVPWLNVLVVPSLNLNDGKKFDDATVAVVQLFKRRNNIFPMTGTADMHVFVTIWQKSSPRRTNTRMKRGRGSLIQGV
jgi:hypothetical protein